MAFIIDLIVVLIIGYFLVRGYKKGFVISLVDSFSCIFSFIATFFAYRYVVPYIASSPVGEFISENIEKIIVGLFAENTNAIISELNLPAVLANGISDGTLISNAAGILALNITNALIALVTIVVLYIVIRLLLKLIKEPIKMLASLPVIKQINTLLGVITGFVAGCFWVYVIMALIALLSFVPFIGSISALIANTSVAKIFYFSNIILSILG